MFTGGGNPHPNPSPIPGNDDHGNSIASATRINANSTTSGRLERGGDNDFFRVALTRSGTLELSTSGSTDTYGYLLNSSGSVIARNDDGGAGTNFKIQKVLSAGTYYVQVRGYSRSTTGSYSLRSSVSYQGGGSTTTLNFPVSGTGWSHTSGSRYHTIINNSGLPFDDTYALDLNLNTPSYNSDRGMSVRPVADGRIIHRSATLGFVLIEHHTPLRLDNGTVYNTWYSGYMHMRDRTNATTVTTDTILGRISRLGADNDHLHFAIYILRNGRYTSIDIRNNLSAFANHISYWY